jgi:hypothetical protein
VIIKENEMGKTGITHGQQRNMHKIMAIKLQGKRPFDKTGMHDRVI